MKHIEIFLMIIIFTIIIIYAIQGFKNRSLTKFATALKSNGNFTWTSVRTSK
ncbi:MAG: hypothetical protein ACMG6E_03930 [Candidatus Roizmanbacteria bacterium]